MPASVFPNFAPDAVFISGHTSPCAFAAAQLADQIDAGGDVAPLIAAAHLQTAAVAIEQLQEVVGLQQQVAELGERDAFLALEPPVHRLLLQHVVDGEVLAGVAQERRADRSCPSQSALLTIRAGFDRRRSRGTAPAARECRRRSRQSARATAARAPATFRSDRRSSRCRRRRSRSACGRIAAAAPAPSPSAANRHAGSTPSDRTRCTRSGAPGPAPRPHPRSRRGPARAMSVRRIGSPSRSAIRLHIRRRRTSNDDGRTFTISVDGHQPPHGVEGDRRDGHRRGHWCRARTGSCTDARRSS